MALGLSKPRGLFELTVGPFRSGELCVAAFSGREEISNLFQFDVDFLTEHPFAELRTELLSQRATLSLAGPGEVTRHVHGMISSLQSRGARRSTGRLEYRARIVPRMWRLSQRRTSRIFQDVTVAEVISQVLAEHLVPVEWLVTRQLPKRAYVLQYDETDLAFVERLLAQYGLFYLFDHPRSVPDRAEERASMLAGSETVRTTLPELEGIASPTAGALGPISYAALRGPLADGGEVVRVGDAPTAYRTMPVREATELGFALEFQRLASMAADASDSASRVLSAAQSAVSEWQLDPTPSVPFSHEGLSEDVEAVTSFSLEERVCPERVELSEFDYRSPKHKRRASARLAEHGASSVLGQVADALSALTAETGLPLQAPSSMAGADAPGSAGVHLHRAEFQEQDATVHLPQVRLEQLRTYALVGQGQSSVRRMGAGYRFVLDDAHVASGLGQDYVVTRVLHRGHLPELADDSQAGLRTYDNEFVCIPSSTVARPPPSPPRATQVLETATVVGVQTGEGGVHTDSLGRIKVEFPWDTKASQPGRSSCWIRAVQTWAGQTFGFQFIPRVGMEVVVAFFGGNVDLPIVLGAAYNASHPVPFPLPEQSAVSGIRTRSVGVASGDAPLTEGANELYFDDARGRERLVLHAERDLHEEAEYSHIVRVGTSGMGDQSTRIATDQFLSVGRNQEIETRGHRFDHVYGCVVVDIDKTHTVSIGDSRRETISHGAYLRVGETRTTHVGIDDALYVGGDSTLSVGGTRRVEVVGSYIAGADMDLALSAGRGLDLAGSESVLLRSDRSIRLVCGESVLELLPDRATLVSPSLVLRGQTLSAQAADASMVLSEGKGTITAKTELVVSSDTDVHATVGSATISIASQGGAITLAGDKVLAKGTSGALVLDERATLEGTTVRLSPGGSTSALTHPGVTPDAAKTSWVEVFLQDQFGRPRARERFVIRLANGDCVSGALDRMGRARVAVPVGAAEVLFPDLHEGAVRPR